MPTFEPIEITPRFYQLGTPFFPVYLSLGDDAMLLEGGNSGTFDLIVSQIQKLGIDPERIKYLALTHVHADHVGALPRFKEIWPHIRVVVGDRAPKVLSTEKLVRQFISMDQSIADIMYDKGEISSLPEKHDHFSLPLDEFVIENDKIDLGGGVCWTAFSTRGHSPGHIAWREEKEEILVIGDTIGFYVPEQDTFWPNYFFSLVEYCNSIRKLGGMTAKWIALGHNGVIKGDGREFFQRALSVTESYHHEMMTRTARGEDLDAIAKEKAEWVFSISDRMPAKATQPLCKLLIKISQKESEHPDLSFKLDPVNRVLRAEDEATV
jgi:glyoxylase-like metal-dependent hydrolase (beta-lactamase superfamily II)